MKARDASERSLIGRRVGDIKDPLDPKRYRLRDAHIPMQVGTGKGPTRALRRIETTLIHADPKIGPAPQLRESRMDPRRFTSRPECRMTQKPDPDCVAGRIPVPRLRIR